MLYQIVHHTAGRYRIRIPRLAVDQPFAAKLTQLIQTLDFVSDVRINPAACSLVVNYAVAKIAAEAAQQQLTTCIQQTSCVWKLQASTVANVDMDEAESEEADLIPQTNQWKDLGLPLLSLSLAVAAAPLELPPLLLGAALAGAALPWFNRATDSLVNHGHPNTDLLDSVWMSLQVLQGQFIAPALKTTLVECRRTLRGTVIEQRQQTALDWISAVKQPVWIERDSIRQTVAVSSLQVGDSVWVQAGERIPVDGEILSGAGVIDCPFATAPHPSTVGQTVYAASLLLEGELQVKVHRLGNQTRIGLIADLIQSAPVHDTHLGAHQAELAKHAIFPTLLLGGTVFATTGNLGAAISPFQFDFGSGIPISISTTLLTALTQAAQQGVYIRSGRVLEQFVTVDTVIFNAAVLVQGHQLRLNSMRVVATLQAQGCSVYLTGSNPVQIADLARILKIPAAQTLDVVDQQPALIRGLKNQGRTVAMVATHSHATDFTDADISVLVGSPELITETTADVILLEADLRGLLYGRAIAQLTLEKIYQNTAMIVLPNLLMQIGGGMILGVNPTWNVIVNNSSAFIAEFLQDTRTALDTITLDSVLLAPEVEPPQIPSSTSEVALPVLPIRTPFRTA
jgi:cation transport ATPase